MPEAGSTWQAGLPVQAAASVMETRAPGEPGLGVTGRKMMGHPQKDQDCFSRGNEEQGTGWRGHDSHKILALLDHLPSHGTEPQHTT